MFYRQSDTIRLKARTVELVDRGYPEVMVRLSPEKLHIGEDEFDPATVPHLEAQASELVLPREAMGLGDVKFMAAIGAFLGWQAVIFSLMLSSMLGAVVGVGAIALGRREWSSGCRTARTSRWRRSSGCSVAGKWSAAGGLAVCNRTSFPTEKRRPNVSKSGRAVKLWPSPSAL